MPSKPLYDDPVVAEIRLIRERLLAECGGKPDEFCRRLREGDRFRRGYMIDEKGQGATPNLH